MVNYAKSSAAPKATTRKNTRMSLEHHRNAKSVNVMRLTQKPKTIQRKPKPLMEFKELATRKCCWSSRKLAKLSMTFKELLGTVMRKMFDPAKLPMELEEILEIAKY